MQNFSINISEGQDTQKYQQLSDVSNMIHLSHKIHNVVSHLVPLDWQMMVKCDGTDHMRCYYEFVLTFPMQESDEVELWHALDGFCLHANLCDLHWDFTDEQLTSNVTSGKDTMQRVKFNIKWQADY